MEFISKSVKETQKIAADLARQVVEIRVASPSSSLKNNSNFHYLARKIIRTKKGAVIALEGELGAGKTTFIQGFARALRIKEKIKSPTFVLMKKYVSGETNLYHLDCYRVGNYKDLKIPELKEILDRSHNRNIVLIEWAERVRKILPKKHITVHIDHIDKNTRKLLITY